MTPLFFIGATSGATLAQLMHLPSGEFAAFGFVAVLAAAANTPLAAAVMAMGLRFPVRWASTQLSVPRRHS